MIDTRVYKLQAELPTTKLDENGREIHQWTTIYVQVNKDTFEYSQVQARAFMGDYDDVIPHARITFEDKKNEGHARVQQQVKKGKSEQPKVLFIKEDDSCPNDFEKVCRVIREASLEAREIGRPI